jgi:hypothetical protein
MKGAAHLGLLIGCAILAVAGLGWGVVTLVCTDAVPLWAHASVEFFGWWFIFGLCVAWVWMLVMNRVRDREARWREFERARHGG